MKIGKNIKRKMRYFGLDPHSKWDREIYLKSIKGGKGRSSTGLANGNTFVHLPKSANKIRLASTIEGQLSDGKWENSPSMKKYWQKMTTTNNGVIIQPGWGGSRWNKETGYPESPSDSPKQIKNKLADLATQILRDDTSKSTREFFEKETYVKPRNKDQTYFFDRSVYKYGKNVGTISPTVGEVKKAIKDLKK